MPQGMRPYALGDACCLGCFDDDAMQLPDADRLEIMLPGKQLSITMDLALPVADLPATAQEAQEVIGKHGITILSALAALDPQQHAFAVHTSRTLSIDTSATRRPAP